MIALDLKTVAWRFNLAKLRTAGKRSRAAALQKTARSTGLKTGHYQGKRKSSGLKPLLHKKDRAWGCGKA